MTIVSNNGINSMATLIITVLITVSTSIATSYIVCDNCLFCDIIQYHLSFGLY